MLRTNNVVSKVLFFRRLIRLTIVTIIIFHNKTKTILSRFLRMWLRSIGIFLKAFFDGI